MAHASTFLQTLEERDLYRFESAPELVFLDARESVLEWTDLNASVTDFVVATHVVDLGIDHIATYDRHYDSVDVATLPYVTPPEPNR
ncbi:hypothetical protein [Halovivax cerinus]|uniref:PIN domain-containing protein n=1 Tax=Halovivax cerinus TaxID=1487865 RepID=A0ABD5NLA5_9EURY|nr:hypothetical protein [Halovivax cerinus]